MATYYAKMLFTTSQGAYDRKQFSTYEIDGDATISGGANGIWILGPSKISYTITVEDYDESTFGEWPVAPNKPYIFFKCTADASFFGDIIINNESGGNIYTFSTNCLVIPQYLVLTLDTAATGIHTWKIA